MTRETLLPCPLVKHIIHDMRERKGFRQLWEGLDDDVQSEIITYWNALSVEYSAHPAAMQSAVSSEIQRKNAVIAEAALCIFRGAEGIINDTIWIPDSICTLYEHLVGELSLDLTGDYETDLVLLENAAKQPMTGQGDKPALYARDLDGTGSLHVCAKGDPGAIPLYSQPIAQQTAAVPERD